MTAGNWSGLQASGEGVHRQVINFPEGRRDQVVYGLLAGEWLARGTGH
jgi:hypothetical protein